MAEQNLPNTNTFGLRLLWPMWLFNTFVGWLPVIFIEWFSTGVWRVGLSIVAVVWLIAWSYSIHFTLVTRYFSQTLLIGGIGIILLGFTGGIINDVILVITVLLFVWTPKYAQLLFRAPDQSE